tara:strand:+ start:112 stop:477 length:366 start_codon:yes stop_codon:yes gene_type:complete
MKARPRNDSTLVYSTDGGKADSGKGRNGKNKKAPQSQVSAPQDGVVRVGRETKGRKGKGVTIVTGVPVHGNKLEDLGRELKGLCGAGGTIKDSTIEIQGDHRDRIVTALEKKGWVVKRAGG